MGMEFIVYQVATDIDLTQHETEFLAFLHDYPLQQEDRGLFYCILKDHLTSENSIITASFSQEHPPLTDSFDEEKELYAPDDSPAIHTFFAFDLKEKFILLQVRDYSTPILDKDITRNRLFRILNEAFMHVYRQQLNTVLTEKAYNEEELLEIFNQNRVSMLRVSFGENASLLRGDTVIFENNDILNNAWVQAWNEDSSRTHEITLKAPGRTGEGDLRKSPLARTILEVPTKQIEEFFYWDANGSQSKVKRNGFKRFQIADIDLHTHPITAVHHINIQLWNRRTELNEYRRIQ